MNRVDTLQASTSILARGLNQATIGSRSNILIWQIRQFLATLLGELRSRFTPEEIEAIGSDITDNLPLRDIPEIHKLLRSIGFIQVYEPTGKPLYKGKGKLKLEAN